MSQTKKIILAVAVVLLSVAVAVSAVFISRKKTPAQAPSEQTTPVRTSETSAATTAPLNTDAVLTTAAETTAVPTTVPTTAAPTTVPETTAAPDMDRAQIIQTFIDAVNKTKSDPGAFTARHVENFDATVTECTGGDVVANIVNGVFSAIIAPKDETLSFVNGTATDKSGASVVPLLPEKGFASLPESGVASASVAADGANTVIDLSLYPESAGLNETPAVHSGCVGYLDTGSLNLSVVQLTGFKFDYTGTSIHAVITPDGYISSVVYTVPVHVEGTGKVAFASGTAIVDGKETVEWYINR